MDRRSSAEALTGSRLPKRRPQTPGERSAFHKPKTFIFTSWAKKSVWAVMDQGLFAVAHFALNVLLARWLSPSDYGAFATGYSLFLLLAGLHTAVISEPLMVFGSGKFTHFFQPYLGHLLLVHVAVSSALALVFFGSAAVLFWGGSTQLSVAVAGLAIVSPPLLLLWLVRRATFVQAIPEQSAVAAGIYIIALLGLAYLARHLNFLSVFVAFAVIGLGSVAPIIWLLGVLKPSLFSQSGVSLQVVFEEHWRYGRWAAPTTLLTWVPSNIYYAVLPLSTGLEFSGQLKALMNVVMPISLVITALSLIAVPNLSAAFSAGSRHSFMTITWKIGMTLLIGSGGYLVALALFGKPLLAWLYQGQYNLETSTLVLAGLLPLFGSVVAVFGAALRAAEQPRAVFWCYVGSVAVALFVGIPLGMTNGVEGSLSGMLIASATTALLMTVFYVQLIRST